MWNGKTKIMGRIFPLLFHAAAAAWSGHAAAAAKCGAGGKWLGNPGRFFEQACEKDSQAGKEGGHKETA